MTRLAALLDQFKAAERALLEESPQSVIVSGVSAPDAAQIAEAAAAAGLQSQIFDAANSEWDIAHLGPELAPFRIEITKPEPPVGVLQLLTNAAFGRWLQRGSECTRWQIARLENPIETQGVLYSPWHDEQEFQPTEATKSPGALVREIATHRLAPQDIRPWLLRDDSAIHLDDESFCTWANAAALAIVRSLASEVDAEGSILTFMGPPRLALTMPEDDEGLATGIGEEAFVVLQSAGRWVFENAREAEMKHILLATELARSGGGRAEVVASVRLHMAHALEGAKIAYQMGLSDLSRDTLASLAELRKSVTDETAKLSDTTRQLAAAVAGAVAIGLTLIVARALTSASPVLIVGIMAVAAMYVGMIVASGWQYVCLQRRLRRDWQPHLYRFLPPKEYDRMVTQPARSAEATFFWSARLGAAVVAVLAALVVFVAIDGDRFSWRHLRATQVQSDAPEPPASEPAAPEQDAPTGAEPPTESQPEHSIQ